MGIASIVASALKNVPWTSLAMNYGPEILRKLKEQIRLREELAAEENVPVADGSAERIQELEALLEEQERVLAGLHERLDLMERTCAALQEQVKLFRILFAAAAAGAGVLLVLLLTR